MNEQTLALFKLITENQEELNNWAIIWTEIIENNNNPEQQIQELAEKIELFFEINFFEITEKENLVNRFINKQFESIQIEWNNLAKTLAEDYFGQEFYVFCPEINYSIIKIIAQNPEEALQEAINGEGEKLGKAEESLLLSNGWKVQTKEEYEKKGNFMIEQPIGE